MNELDRREWLLTNGLGSFASGTVCDARTRIYHGWLIAALEPPSQRRLLLSHFDVSLEIASQVFALSTNFWASGPVSPSGYQFLQSFEVHPVPTWVWGLGDRDQPNREPEPLSGGWQLTRQIIMPYGLRSYKPYTEQGHFQAQFYNGILVRYRYTGQERAILRLRPVIGDRNFHHPQYDEAGLTFSQVVGSQQVLLQALWPGRVGTPWQLRWTQGHYQPEGTWYWSFHYPEETARGLSDREDLYSPGYLTAILQPNDALTLEATAGWPDATQVDLNDLTFEQAIQAEQERLARTFALAPQPVLKPVSSSWQSLLRASDQFVVYRTSTNSPTVIAGYPWLSDWGRDTLMALPGLALATRRFSLARELLAAFSQFCQDGLLPDAFPEAGAPPLYKSLDVSLWWIETLGLYLEAAQDWEFLVEQYPIVQRVYKAFMAGTYYNIQVDAVDGLITWDAPGIALTWMDAIADNQPVTPRRGKPIEINALWYSALCWASQWAKQLMTSTSMNPVILSNQARRYSQQAQQVQASLRKFWNPEQGYFYDTIEPNDHPDSRIRPNAVLALSLHHCGFSDEQGCRVLQVARDRLLTPYGLRSLAPDDSHYMGRYAGEPQQRDRAYHQGTVWTWLLGPFARAWQRFYPDEPLPFDWQPIFEHFSQQDCLGSISEIFDGDFPHHPQGAIAQALSVAELIRQAAL